MGFTIHPKNDTVLNLIIRGDQVCLDAYNSEGNHQTILVIDSDGYIHLENMEFDEAEALGLSVNDSGIIDIQ